MRAAVALQKRNQQLAMADMMSDIMKAAMETEFRSALASAVERFGLEALAADQVDRLVCHYLMLREWNRRVNLTRIVQPAEAARLHFAESILAGRYAGNAQTILDIGSGAGFPAVPLAVTRPESQITAMEPNQKKATFLKDVKQALALSNFKVVTARIEAFDWSGYDLLTSRALDEAERMYGSILGKLSPGKSLLLLCGSDLLARIEEQIREVEHAERAHSHLILEAHQIPDSKTRLIALFSSTW
jgi:16S rRNA (guanine527-N7)-methyltransferase